MTQEIFMTRFFFSKTISMKIFVFYKEKLK